MKKFSTTHKKVLVSLLMLILWSQTAFSYALSTSTTDIEQNYQTLLSNSNMTTLLPISYTTQKGADGGQSVSNLHVQDQSGTQNDWNRYVEFNTPGRTKYDGYRVYELPNSVNATDISSIRLKANYLGPTKKYQTWTWYIYDWSQRKWVAIGNNGSAPSWKWHMFTFEVSGKLTNYINNDTRQIRIRLLSSNAKDDMDLDYEAVIIESVKVPDPTPTPGNWWKPTPGTSWQIQFDGAIDTSFNVDVYFLDLFDTQSTLINQLHQQGRKVVCYFNAGGYEDWRPDANAFPSQVLGNPLDGWPGERWLDIRAINQLAPIMNARLDLAVSKGCDGVDPDNVDGYLNNTGFALSYQNQLGYNLWLAEQAHARGLAIGLKNDLEQISDLVGYFDWAMNEQCFQYNECALLRPFVQAGKPVWGIEYSGSTGSFCPQANEWNFDFLKKKLELNAWREACR